MKISTLENKDELYGYPEDKSKCYLCGEDFTIENPQHIEEHYTMDKHLGYKLHIVCYNKWVDFWRKDSEWWEKLQSSEKQQMIEKHIYPLSGIQAFKECKKNENNI